MSSTPTVAQATTNLETTLRERQDFVRVNRDLILTLPGPDYEWDWESLTDHPDASPSITDSKLEPKRELLKNNDIIRKSGELKKQKWKGTYVVNTWSTARDAYDYAQALRKADRARGDLYPCGHSSGFRTVDAEAGEYECGFDYCDEIYDRETVESVIR